MEWGRGVCGCWRDTWANASCHICPLSPRSLRCRRSVLGLRARQDKARGWVGGWLGGWTCRETSTGTKEAKCAISQIMKASVKKHDTSVFILKHFRLQTKKKKKTEIINQPSEPQNTGDYFLGQDLRFQPSSNTQSRGEHDK